MRIVIVTLFPEYFDSVFNTSILGKAVASEKVSLEITNIRDYATDTQKTTDDRPFGGGPGMVLKVEPIAAALAAVQSSLGKEESCTVLLTSAKGRQYTQAMARDLVLHDVVIIICGHYEGVDERVAELFVDQEVRIGNFVLSGGEPAAAVIADSVIRLLPGVLGNEESTTGESHDTPGVLAYPQYTRPQVFEGHAVPEVLLTGDHKRITQWREEHRGVEVEKNDE